MKCNENIREMLYEIFVWTTFGFIKNKILLLIITKNIRSRCPVGILFYKNNCFNIVKQIEYNL